MSEKNSGTSGPSGGRQAAGGGGRMAEKVPRTSRAPKLLTMFLPPSHPFWEMSDEEFEGWAGVHVRREAVKLIPTSADPACTCGHLLSEHVTGGQECLAADCPTGCAHFQTIADGQ